MIYIETIHANLSRDVLIYFKMPRKYTNLRSTKQIHELETLKGYIRIKKEHNCSLSNKEVNNSTCDDSNIMTRERFLVFNGI